MQKEHSASARNVKRAGFFTVPLLFVMALSGVAFADPADTTGGMFSTLKDNLTTIVIPAAAGVIMVALLFGLATRWVAKASKKT